MRARAIVHSNVESIHASTQHHVEWLNGQSVLSLDWQPLLDLSSPASSRDRFSSRRGHRILDACKHLVARVREGGGDGVDKYHATLSPDEFVRLARITLSLSDNTADPLLFHSLEGRGEGRDFSRGASANHAREVDAAKPDR